ncbi:AMP-dependent synthetase [Azospirillum sp. 412522]|nr:AMP-binding protein [Azospirillum sp. 412522]MBY6261669.1 AMP-dependent synthetase [Azospirillum sp. 412522]
MNQMPESRTLPKLVGELIALHGEREAVVGNGQRLTYAQLGAQVAAVARRLIRLGVGHGDKVGILMGNRPEWIVSALATTSIGGVAVAMNSWATHRELEHLIRHSDCRLLIAAPRFLKHDYGAMLDGMAPLAERLPLLQGVLGIGDDIPAGWMPLLDADGSDAEAVDAEIHRAGDAVRPEDLAFLLYTSGSTSTPKGVQLVHGSVIANPWQIGERQHVVAGDRLWLAVSLFWGLGCVNAMMNLLTHGGCIVLQDSFDPGAALRLIQDERCTLFYGTPNMAQALHNHPDRSRYDLSSLRGGATLGTPEQVMRVVELGATRICNIYGLTETYGNSHVTDAGDPLERRLTSCGRPLPGVVQRIVAPDGADLPPGRIGEVRVKGHVTAGYYKDEALTRQSIDEQGFFRTGDLGYVDEDGYLYFCGRLKEMVKTGGINVAPAEVEAVLMDHPGICVAYVVGVPDDSRDEILGALVVPHPGASLSVEQVLAHCWANLAAYKVPRLVRFVEESSVPLTVTGKVQKNKLAETFFAPVAG